MVLRRVRDVIYRIYRWFKFITRPRREAWVELTTACGCTRRFRIPYTEIPWPQYSVPMFPQHTEANWFTGDDHKDLIYKATPIRKFEYDRMIREGDVLVHKFVEIVAA